MSDNKFKSWKLKKGAAGGFFCQLAGAAVRMQSFPPGFAE